MQQTLSLHKRYPIVTHLDERASKQRYIAYKTFPRVRLALWPSAREQKYLAYNFKSCE